MRIPILSLSLTIVLIALTLLFGCTDEDCPSCPYDPGEKILIDGYMQFSEGNGFRLNFVIITTTGEATPEVDSMTVAGHRVELRRGYDMTLIYFNGGITDTTLKLGDTADIVIYTPFGVDSCRLCLLSEIEFYDWAQEPPWDTVDVNTGFEVAWHSDVGVSYYWVQRFQFAIGISASSLNFMDEQIDTVTTVAAEENDAEGHWQFYVVGYGGTDMEGNTSDYSGSGAVVWRLFTRTNLSELIIYVDDGFPTTVSTEGNR
ncbi:MAG: hypothetical protein JSV52_08700 [Candidatus Zixiibacteriota bacterium]|nr:MAG: hypothetical protein JSV52_08700 [candidate division Zixibacteria bacterium]